MSARPHPELHRDRLDLRPGHGPGVTLIELVVVIVLIAILTAALVPQFGGTFQGALLETTAREIVNTLNLAYSQAVTVNRPHRVRMDLDERIYWLEVLAESESGDRRFIPVEGLSVASRTGEDTGVIDERLLVEIEDEIREGSDRGRPPGGDGEDEGKVKSILFRPDGSAQARRILLRDIDGFGIAILVNPTTARVSSRRLEQEVAR